jgi:branched-chain amino acid transport system ATP-binding protein
VSFLSAQRLEVSYGEILAVKGIDLHVDQGELVCLIGANGAGKTTALKALAGMLPTARGEILFEGQRVERLPSHARVRRGMALTPEGRGVFVRLTVEENLRLGAHTRAQTDGVRDDLEHVYGLFPRLAERRRQAAGTLSGGEQQMLAIGRALMSHPRLLLLDEPSMGLAPILVQKIFDIIRRIASEGVTLLLVEQNARLALEIANRAYVMESGRITLHGPARELLHDPRVREAYLGG